MEEKQYFTLIATGDVPTVVGTGITDTDYRCYVGVMRKLIREWDKCETDTNASVLQKGDYRRPTTALLRIAAGNGFLRNEKKEALDYKPGLRHLSITVKPSDDGKNADVAISVEGEETAPLFLSETLVLTGTHLYEVPEMDKDICSTIPMLAGNLPKTKLAFCLSMLASDIPGAAILWDGYEVKERKPIVAENALFFRDINKFGHLFVDSGISLPTFGFIRSKGLPLSRLATIDDATHTVTLADIVFPTPAPEERLKELMGKKAAKSTHEEEGRFVFDGEMAVDFLKNKFSDLVASFTLYQTEVLRKYKIAYAKPSISFHMKSGIDFLEGTTNVSIENESFTLSSFLSLLEKQGFVKLSDGTDAFVGKEFVSRIERLITHKGGQDRISFYDLPIIEKEGYSFDDDTPIEEFTSFYKGINTLGEGKGKFPLKESKLRPYQEYGCKWLAYLDSHHMGGCLADEMGLGKTVQVIAFLAGRKPNGKNSLLIAPKSILVNWEREVARFSSMPTLIYHGSERNAVDLEKTKNTIIISSYATVRNDIKKFAALSFDYVILDESQNIKTERSQTTQAILLLQCDHKLAISGTPIENHLGDLFSLFRFLNPSLFPSEKLFNTNYAKPIASGNDEALADLKMKIYPFILRRTKQAVLPDLPPITEEVSMITMKENHFNAYEQRRLEIRKTLNAKVKQAGFEKSTFIILQALTELRQYATLPESKTGDDEISAKREYLSDTLPDIVQEHKVLIFTNFLDTIEKIGEDLDTLGIGYLTMTGSTNNRQMLLDAFQNDPQYRVCLMTLKTGGVGLNLTAADYVFIMDPWWNVAAEEQAINRTHRIGQTNPVFCYRLIAKDTIEEKMLELQEKKSELASSLLQNDQAGVKKLTEADLDALLG